ncbi:MAG TPA: ABC transporter permease [Thermomicrobiaceae bacterium]|nr:ABC transporter permease [Thermomicrobiaceae bacterium]
MKALRYMVLANLRMTLRNRSALFWLLAFPVIFIVLFGYLFSGGNLDVNVGVVGAGSSALTTQVTGEMKQVSGFTVTTGTRAAELSALQQGNRDVVVVFGPGAQPGTTSAQIYYDQSNPQTSQVAVAAIRQFFDQANQAITKAATPIVATVQGVNTQHTSYIDFLVPGILAMSIMNNGMIGLSSSFVTYRERGILRRIRATPFPLWMFIVARVLTQVLIAVLQSVILLAVATGLFHVKISGDVASLVAMIALGSLAFLSIGFLISGLARNTEVADSLSNALAFPMMFLGGVFFPLDAAPAWMRPITDAIPLTYFANGLRDIMIHGATLFGVWSDALVMLGTAAIALVLAVRFFRWEAQTV